VGRRGESVGRVWAVYRIMAGMDEGPVEERDTFAQGTEEQPTAGPSRAGLSGTTSADSSSDPDGLEERPFDFSAHGEAAAEEYRQLYGPYEHYAQAIASILLRALEEGGLQVHSIVPRAKSVASMERKASTQDEDDPTKPMYPDPFRNITDLAGVRIITYFLDTVVQVCEVVEREFEIIERIDKGEELRAEDRLGYQSVHYVVKLAPNRSELPEYSRLAGLVGEIQVRTILQHSWAEIEHDIQYKSVETLPTEIRRRFMSLAGVLEMADREFQAISDEEQRLRAEARGSIAEGRLDAVEITPDALKVYLDRRLGGDARMSDFSYQDAARTVRRLGFRNFEQVNAALDGYNDYEVSRVMHGNAQGQLSRFEDVLLAAMGESFVPKHPLGHLDWFRKWRSYHLDRLKSEQIPIGSYAPQGSKGSVSAVEEE
jgi:putative GTP pyrophosphokinase